MKNAKNRARNLVNLALALASLTSCVALPGYPWKFIASGALVGVNKPADAPLNRTANSSIMTLQATERGKSSVYFHEGVNLPLAYIGDKRLAQILEQNLAQPLALASGDFDEDGMQDLVSGYAGPDGGILSLHRGNLASIYPNSPEARLLHSRSPSMTGEQRTPDVGGSPSPFLSPALVFAVPEAPEFLGTGDFDADGHLDVVVAARGGNVLYLLSGDGRGCFGSASAIELPGGVTALVTGEINRADGLTDVVVGTSGADGPQALVFEGPEGALKAKPEAFALPAEATALALGRLDADYLIDLAVASGDELLIMRGRDRKLSLDEIRQAEVPPAMICQRSFPFAISSMVVGDFAGGNRPQLALLAGDGTVHLVSEIVVSGERQSASNRGKKLRSERLAAGSWPRAAHLVRARVSNQSNDGLIVMDQANRQLLLLTLTSDSPATSAPKAESVLASPGSQVSTLLELQGEPVALLPMRLNANAGSDLVILRKGQSAPAIALTSAAMSFTVTNTDDGGSGSLRQAISEANKYRGAIIVFDIPGNGPYTITPGSSLVLSSPMTIDGTSQPGFKGTPVIELNGASASYINGLTVDGGSSVVRGLAINDFKLTGILLNSSGNIIEGNFIGTDVSGTIRRENLEGGVRVPDSPNNIIGGTTTAARNVISGNGLWGVFIGITAQHQPTGATGNVVQGNFIGTDLTGCQALRSSSPNTGVYIRAAANNLVGGTIAYARNIISGNGTGVDINNSQAEGTWGNLVQGNFIGTDVTGTKAVYNSHGVSIGWSPDNTIGGTIMSARNVISGNFHGGVSISDAAGNLVQGNLIGPDVTGTSALGSDYGVGIASGNILGGTIDGARNVISGHIASGVGISGSGVVVQGNFIGTDATGTKALPNGYRGFPGVLVYGSDHIIGGTTLGARNLISGNYFDGVGIYAATGNLLQGNFIGTQVDGLSPLGNQKNGVLISDLSNNNTIGGTDAGAGNTIAYNSNYGVWIKSGADNAVLTNSIFSNSYGYGIAFGEGGVPSNDPGDSDAGPNNLQNYPVLTSTTGSSTGMSVRGTLNSKPNTTFRLEFFSNSSGCDQGEQFIGSATVTTEGNGNAPFDANLPVSVPAGRVITATATDPEGNTSGFSACLLVTNSPPLAKCRNVTKAAEATCQAFVTTQEVDNGSSDPDGDSITFGLSPSGPYPLGIILVTLAVIDSKGASNTCTATVTVVDNMPPAITCPANVSMVGNVLGQCSATVSPGKATAIDNCSSVIIDASRSDGLALTDPYPQGTTNITWKATDAAGSTASCQQMITVLNPNPVVTITGPSSGAIFAVGTAVNFTGTFTDNPGGRRTAVWAFDTITQAGTVDEEAGKISTTAAFTTPGVYLVKLTVTDSCGGTSTATTVGGLEAMIVIYDPDGGFVSGGGWIDSPPGAYRPDLALTGKASFGFVSKYQHGAAAPSGETEFQFTVANLNFHSSSYDWLVVAGARAQYKGSGTINGAGSYGFLLTAIDGQINGGGGVDKFRIKIWDKNNGGAIIYDNQFGAGDDDSPSTALGGGSIVIHK